MHLFFENISINMFKHWSGTFFKSGNGENYIISNAIWKVIGKTMEKVDGIFHWNLVDHHVIFINILMDSKPKNGPIG